MENKKPLIIVPPMSEPMIKLKEILEGIAAEENIEIFTVEDAKEFTQLLGSGGQSLVMMSNAKLCATLLQENKSIISKHHTKVILLTPKEIPIKTLEKFRKVGLTESILESTAPKTLLYKVKLQLKSIKITNKEDSSQQVIKTMLDSGPKMKIAEDEMSITETKSADEITNTNEDIVKKIQKNEEENTLDYLGSLKGKKAKAEEQIETHWKSKREISQVNEAEEDIYSKPKIEVDDDIDMYYRGKLKKNNNELEVEEEDLYQKKNIVNEEEAADYDLERKIQEEEVEAVEKRKKNIISEEEENDFYDKKEKALEEEQSAPEKRKKALIEEETIDDFIEKKNKVDDEEKQDKKRESIAAEDLGGHYKGKLNTERAEETEEEYEDKKEIIEEVSLEKEKKKQEFTEEESLEKEKKSKLLEDEADHESGEGKVDHIDNYMRGDSETTAAIKTRMESESNKNKDKLEEVDSDDLKKKNQAELAEAEEEHDNNRLKLEEEANDDLYKKNELKPENNDSEAKNKEKSVKLEEEKEFERKNIQLNNEDEDDFNKNKDSNEKVESELTKRNLEKRIEEEKESKRSNSTNLDIEKSKETTNHSGKADKISTYYKSGENNKKDQDWDLPQDKKSTTLDIVKAKPKENYLSNSKKINDEEVVIDYKKLKEEFEQISKDGFVTSDSNGNIAGTNRGKNYSSEEEYKVIEIGPHAFDFTIDILNLIYQNEIKANLIIKTIAEKLFNEEKAILITEQYKLSEKKYNETFNGLNEFASNLTEEVKSIGDEYIKTKFNLDKYHTYSMPLWMCQSIPDNDGYWKDYDLPSWAKNELSDKPVELIYPFFDGVDRMGFAYLLFPTGINPINEKKIIIILEMLRSVFLDSVQRAKQPENSLSLDNSEEKHVEPAQNKIVGFFGNLFGKKKAG